MKAELHSLPWHVAVLLSLRDLNHTQSSFADLNQATTGIQFTLTRRPQALRLKRALSLQRSSAQCDRMLHESACDAACRQTAPCWAENLRVSLDRHLRVPARRLAADGRRYTWE